MSTIDKLIINSAYQEPTSYWQYDSITEGFNKVSGRRKAGYLVAQPGADPRKDPGRFVELPLVNRIRPLVKAWRESGYPGVTRVTKDLLDHWNDNDSRTDPFFWCQHDAIETLIWLEESPEAKHSGINVPGDGGPFDRICTKLCTGGGKTTVMAMLIAWQIYNKVVYPQDKRFSKYVFIVAPNVTVKNRLQVLQTGGDDNYYAKFNIVSPDKMEKLRQGKVVINNWHALAWDSDEAINRKKGGGQTRCQKQ